VGEGSVGKLRPTALIALTFILVGTARGSVPSYLDQSQSVAQTTALNPDASEDHTVTWTGVNVTADTATVQTLELFLAGDGGFIDGGFEARKANVAGAQTQLPADVQPTQTITKTVLFPGAAPAKYVVVETEQTQPTPAPANWQLFAMPLIPVVAPGAPAPQAPPPLQLGFPVNIAPNGPATIVDTMGPKGNGHPHVWLPVQVQCFGKDPIVVHTLSVRIGQYLPGYVTIVTDVITVEATVLPCQSTLVNLFERIPFANNNKPIVINMDVDYTDATTLVPGTASAQFPVTVDTNLPQLRAPVLGTFNYGNGPGMTVGNGHAPYMAEKWAYDLTVTAGDGLTHQIVVGDQGLDNQNFFCWGKPVYAMTSGTVVGSLGTSTDNNAYQMDGNGPPNFVTIQDASGLLTFYAHFQQNSVVPLGTQVNAGDQIGLIGNSGGTGSSEPHLHIEAIVIDATGHHKGRPMTFLNLFSASNNKKINGVPIAPYNYTSIAPTK
jgi:hypothetical protein